MLQTNINPRGGRPRAVPRKTMDTLMQEHTAPDAEAVEIAFQAVRLFAETHPRPVHVTQSQAAEMLDLSRTTVHRLVKAGALRLNGAGMIPTAEVDKVIAAR